MNANMLKTIKLPKKNYFFTFDEFTFDNVKSIPSAKRFGSVSQATGDAHKFIFDFGEERPDSSIKAIASLSNTKCQSDLDNSISSFCANLFYVNNIININTREVEICIISFNGPLNDLQDTELPIVFSEEFLEKASKQFNTTDFMSLEKKIRNEFFLGEYYKFIIGSFAFEKDSCAFSMYSSNWQINVKKIKVNDNIVYSAEKLVTATKNPGNKVSLLRGKIVFKEQTTEAYVSEVLSHKIKGLADRKESFIRLWDEYNKTETELVFNKIREFGAPKCVRIEPTGEETYFLSPEKFPSFTDGLEPTELSMVFEVPEYVSNENYTARMFYESLVPDFKEEDEELKETLKEIHKAEKQHKQEKQENEICGLPIKLRDGKFEITVKSAKTHKQIEQMAEHIGNKDVYLVYSANGDIAQIKRRLAARKKILAGAENPALGFILEGDESARIPIQNKRKQEALSPFVEKKLFSDHKPSENQIKAIELALNTPDIAIIQGPPGTGKTTVINAIIERLNEEYDKSSGVTAKVLVSSTQHVAVENVTERSNPNGIPIPKNGEKLNADIDEETSSEHIAESWCSEIHDNLVIKYPNITTSEQRRKLHQYAVEYINSPSKAGVNELFKLILAFDPRICDSKIIDKIAAIKKMMDSDDNQDLSPMLPYVYALRTDLSSFKDDGIDRIGALLFAFKDGLDSEVQNILNEGLLAISMDESALTNYLDKLSKLKLELLKDLCPQPHFRRMKGNSEIIEIIKTVSERLDKGITVEDKKLSAIAEFMHSLTEDPRSMVECINQYNFAVAATIQQSASEKMNKKVLQWQGIDYEPGKNVVYDVAIIDEAARVSPLDLMIPMANAKKIILVGDHKQLPHMLDEKTMEKMGESEQISDYYKSILEKSLFEKLYNFLEPVGKTVTLDIQHRNHPVLGKYISDNFYLQDGSSVSSPDSESFKKAKAQHLSLTNQKPCMWIDVSNGSDDYMEQKRGTSHYRLAEAKVIAKLAKRWIDESYDEHMTFGFVTFYSAQKVEIRKALEKEGVNIYETFMDKETHKLKRRLEIGTVDEFQGKEFDVAFLSAVRSKSLNFLENRKIPLPGIFGHLMSKNRLCVAMSRQKKLLVVVGDSNLMTSSYAQKGVPEITNFYNLCKTDGTILEGKQIENGD